MEDWNKAKKLFASKEKAEQSAQIIAVTESRLNSVHSGPQYTIETKIEEAEGGWQVFWKKVLLEQKSGCGEGCGSCKAPESPTKKNMGKVLPFRKPQA